MGYVQIGLVQNEVPIEQNVEIERSGTVANSGRTIAAKVVLDVHKGCQERCGGEIRFESNDGVEEAGLIGESLGRRGVERRAAANPALGSEAIDGSRECDIGRAGRTGDVGADADVGGLHDFRVARGGEVDRKGRHRLLCVCVCGA